MTVTVTAMAGGEVASRRRGRCYNPDAMPLPWREVFRELSTRDLYDHITVSRFTSPSVKAYLLHTSIHPYVRTYIQHTLYLYALQIQQPSGANARMGARPRPRQMIKMTR